MSKNNKFFALPMLMGALFIAGTTQNAHAANTAQAELQVETIAEIDVSDNLTAFTPARSDYEAFQMVQSNAISLNVFANKGYKVTVAGQASGANLESTDLFVRPHVVGAWVGGTDISSPVTLADTSVASAVLGDTINLDVKVALPTAGKYAPGTTYSNTMTFTVTADS